MTQHFPHTSGPLDSRIAFVGELEGTEEQKQGKPLVGSSGEEFNRMLAFSGLLTPQQKGEGHASWMKKAFKEREDKYFITNVLHATGPVEKWCVTKNQASEEYESEKVRLKEDWPDFRWPQKYSWSPVGGSGKYLRPQYLDVLPRLQRELLSLENCNLVVPLGGVALWALSGSAGIMNSRGAPLWGRLVEKKLLPTFNPAYILRTWQDRPIMLADLKKIKEESDFPDIRTPSREIWLAPSIDDLWVFDEKYLKHSSLIAADIETSGEQIEMVGFASDSGHALPVPFIDFLRPKYSYWPSERDEKEAWKFCHTILTRETPKLYHNSLFDVQYLWQKMGIPSYNSLHDTMYAHHSLQPEMKKGLAFLATLYCTEAQWKSMRSGKDDKDDE